MKTKKIDTSEMIENLTANPDLFNSFSTQGLIMLAKEQFLKVSPKAENYNFNSAVLIALLAIAQGLNDLWIQSREVK